jgi:hypothetical protein
MDRMLQDAVRPAGGRSVSANSAEMRSLPLHTALTQHIEAVAAQLHAEVLNGAEVPFELEQQSRRRGSAGPTLYCYRPLTAQFIDERLSTLERLPSHAEAARLLAELDGLDRYMVSAGVDCTRMSTRTRVSASLAELLGDVFAEQTDFLLRPERLEAALARLERTALSASSEMTTLVATLHGLTITSAELALTKGLTIAQPHALEGLPAGALAPTEGDGRHLVVVLAVEQQDHALARVEGAEVLKDLERALRLFGDGRVTLGMLAWARVGSGVWNPLPLGGGGRPHGMLVVTPEQEDELRAFCSLVSRRAPHANELAWALSRFEMGCERNSPYEALTDHLLALRALLEPEAASGLLSRRLAALCATPDRRDELIERTGQALALERSFLAGAAVEHAGAETLCGDIADHLRALLRDIICGHLNPDLIGLADELLLTSASELTEPEEQTVLPEDSIEEMLRDPSQAPEIVDVFI